MDTRANSLILLEENFSKKDLFLSKLKSSSINNYYKRYLGSPLRYAGGKSLAVGYILELLPNDLDLLVSPFMGGGSVEIAIAKELGISVVAYDVFDLLVNYWKYQIEAPEDLYNKLKEFRPNKIDGYDYKLDPIDAAAYYYYNMQLSYGPGFLGWMSSIYENENKYIKTIDKVKNFNVKNIQVKCDSFEKSIPRHINDFLYLDPPYFLEGDSKMFKGIYPMRNFPIHHNNFDHKKLLDLLKSHKGGFILSYNDCDWVRQNYCDFEIIDVKWQYTMGQGETRIGKNRINRDFDNTNVKSSHEIIIYNRRR